MYNKINSNIIFGSYMIKYDRLSVIFPEYYKYNEYCTNVNLYIDFDNITRRLYSSSVDTFTIEDIVMGMINLLSHYRRYFRSIGVTDKIYVIRSTSLINTMKLSEYDSKRILTTKNKAMEEYKINKAMSLFSKICMVLPRVYYYSGRYEPVVVMKSLVDKFNIIDDDINMEHIFLSQDNYSFKIVEFDKCALLRPYKSNNVDNSFILGNKTNLKDVWTHYYNCKGVNSSRWSTLPLRQISLLETFWGLKERQVTSYIPYNEISKLIKEAIKLSGDPNINLYSLYNYISNTNILPNIDGMVIRYQIIDIPSQLEIIDDIYVDEFDAIEPQSLAKINRQYFNNQIIFDEFYYN